MTTNGVSPTSAVETCSFRGKTFYLKRDDRLDPCLSGNKYRKLYALIHQRADAYRRVVSHGGVQSNAMLSIACLCHRKGWSFDYYVRRVPPQLRTEPFGNLERALGMGMRLHECGETGYEATLRTLRSAQEPATLFIPQGGADPLAETGVSVLAREIEQFVSERRTGPLRVATPSGTGTTAYYLAKHLPELTVLSAPTVSSAAHLLEQMRALGPIPSNLKVLETGKRYRFARPDAQLFALWNELKEAGALMDMIYAPKLWQALVEHDAFAGVLYVHSGGLDGNETMLKRYEAAGLSCARSR